MVPPGASAAVRALVAAGIQVDTQVNRHDGQGTASVAAFFANAYLELLWVDSSVTVDSDHTVDLADFRRAANWRQTGASPFGLGLHALATPLPALPIPVRPDSIPGAEPPAAYLLLRLPAESLTPDLFIMPPDRAVTAWIDRYQQRRPERFVHPLGVHRVTGLMLQGTPAQWPRAAMVPIQLVRFERGDVPLLTVEFDGGRLGQVRDLRPALPLILRR